MKKGRETGWLLGLPVSDINPTISTERGLRNMKRRPEDDVEYEGQNSITYSCLILMQPLGADQATVAHMKAVNVPFQ